MKKFITSERGFAHLALVLIIVGAIAVVGIWTYQRYSVTPSKGKAALLIPFSTNTDLGILLSPLSISGTYSRGTPNVKVLALKLINVSAENVHINSLVLRGRAGQSNGNLRANYASLASMVTSPRLYEGESTTPIPAVTVSKNLSISGFIIWSNMDWIIPGGMSKVLLLKVDLSNNIPGINDTFSFDLESAADIIVSTDMPGGTVLISGADLNGSYTASQVITVSGDSVPLP